LTSGLKVVKTISVKAVSMQMAYEGGTMSPAKALWDVDVLDITVSDGIIPLMNVNTRR
jgi:hypothetical protein